VFIFEFLDVDSDREERDERFDIKKFIKKIKRKAPTRWRYGAGETPVVFFPFLSDLFG